MKTSTKDARILKPLISLKEAGTPSLRILLLSHYFYPEIGGIEVNSEIYARAFAAAGHDVHLLTWSVIDTEVPFPFTVVRNPSNSALFKEHAWADIVFENNPCLRMAWPGLFFGRPSVVSMNTELYRTSSSGWFSMRWVKRAWLWRTGAVISVSDALRKQFWPAASVIGNPYRAQDFKVLDHISRTDNFVFLGRLVSQKGADLAVEAFHCVLAKLAERDPGAPRPTLTIIGDGPERANLEQQVAALHLGNYVRFTGFMQGRTLVEELNRHRYLLVPSLYGEAFGNVVLEGMACGCLPIVSDSDGLPEAAGRAGLVFRRNDANALAAAIYYIIHEPVLEMQLREAAPAHLSAHQPEAVSQRYLQVLEATLPATAR
ncbi:MAG: glycosyltransferase family 4 protein [Janthinobacterium lividum]